MNRNLAYLLISFLLINISACAQQDEKGTMTVTELKSKLNDTSVVILDVRLLDELSGPLGHIDGLVHIPLQELKTRMHELDQYKDKEIAVVCRSGNRSNTATSMLRANGFNAKNVEGGMIEYRKSEAK